MKRYEHRPRLLPNEAPGCGAPICVIIDSRPKRFASMCSFIGFIVSYAMHQRIFHIQKGDCAYASKFKDSLLLAFLKIVTKSLNHFLPSAFTFRNVFEQCKGNQNYINLLKNITIKNLYLFSSSSNVWILLVIKRI